MGTAATDGIARFYAAGSPGELLARISRHGALLAPPRGGSDPGRGPPSSTAGGPWCAAAGASPAVPVRWAREVDGETQVVCWRDGGVFVAVARGRSSLELEILGRGEVVARWSTGGRCALARWIAGRRAAAAVGRLKQFCGWT